MQTPGVPDLIVFHPTRGLFFVECKRPGGRQSNAQCEFQLYCAAARIPYILGGATEVATFLGAKSSSP
jgi:hypothetical protein